MNILKKSNKLYYHFQENTSFEGVANEEAIGLFLEQSTVKSSCWWSNLKGSVTSDFRSHFDYFANSHKHSFQNKELDEEPPQSMRTAKTCPGISQVIKTSVLLKSPCDMVLSINSEGKFLWNASNKLAKVHEHNSNQFYTESCNIFEGKVALKIVMPINIGTEGDSWMFLQPTYHNNIGYTVVNGVISGKHTSCQQLNMIFMVDIPKNDDITVIDIKRGDVLAYLWFDKTHSLIHKENLKGRITHIASIFGKGPGNS